MQMKKNGLSMIEVLVVTAVLAILIIVSITTLPRQMEKARDSERKSDLQKIKISFENYYNDNGCYPATGVLDNCGVEPPDSKLVPYLKITPCDPENEQPYLYAPYDSSGGAGTCDGYRVWSNLEKDDDPVVAQLNCNGLSGCGAYEFFESMGSEASEYNYGVSEGVPVFTGNAEAFLTQGFCCAGGVDQCNAWSYDGGGTNQCNFGPYLTIGECYSNTTCLEPTPPPN